MPVQVSYPGIYVQELPSTAHTVTGATTSSTAFADFFPRGPVGRAVQVNSWTDFQRIFGGLDTRSEASYGVWQYFLNGGQIAWIIRLVDTDAAAAGLGGTMTVSSPSGGVVLGTPAASQAPVTVPVTWTPSAALTGKSPLYGVLLSTDGGHTFRQVAAPAAGVTSPYNLNLPAATSAIPAAVQVVAVDANGNTLASSTGGAFTIAPASTPTISVTVVGVTINVPSGLPIQVSWTAPALAGGAKPASYTVLLSTDGGSSFTQVGTTADTKYSISGVARPAAAEQAVVQVVAGDGLGGVLAAGTSKPFTLQPDAAAPPAPAPEAQAATTGKASGKSAKAAAPDAAPQADGTDAAAGTAADAAAGTADGGTGANGGTDGDGDTAAAAAPASQAPPAFVVAAANPGVWGNNLQVNLSPPQQVGSQPPAAGTFNLSVMEIVNKQVVNSESYQNLNLDSQSPQYAPAVLAASSLVTLTMAAAGASGPTLSVPAQAMTTVLTGGADGTTVNGGTLLANAYAVGNPLAPLDQIAPSVFNIMSLPALANAGDGAMQGVVPEVMQFCADRQAFFILDIPSNVSTVDLMKEWAATYMSEENYSAAVYFPRLVIADPLNGYRPRNVAASGTMAGVYARIDTSEGVWKAPAGTEATLEGASLALQMTDAENGELNPLGINALRSFPIYGNISWGARTLAGADQIDSQWKYIPVRRLVDYIEQSLVGSLKWAVFQPNDATLWASLRLEIGTFLAGLFSQGALAGATPDQAYFVTCDETTTTASNIDQGIVNVLIGIAPVKPAEFVILKFQQLAGQTS